MPLPRKGMGWDAAMAAASFEELVAEGESVPLECWDFLRKVLWTVPGFTVDGYRGQLARLHERIQADGSFVSHTQRFLIEARARARSSWPSGEMTMTSAAGAYKGSSAVGLPLTARRWYEPIYVISPVRD